MISLQQDNLKEEEFIPENKHDKQEVKEGKKTEDKEQQHEVFLTFGGHLEILRKMLFRILAVVGIIAVAVFCFKNIVWTWLLVPSEWDFCTYRWIENFLQAIGTDFHFEPFHVNMIATELSSQFMTHISTSIYLGILFASPYIVYELFKFISPALYEKERKYSVKITCIIYILFILGVLMSYFILFPVSFRFLGTYSVSEKIVSNITIDSYVSTFTSLTLVMGLVFQLPVIAFFLGKIGVITSKVMSHYKKHALIIIMLVAAIITPPDIMTLILVSLPLYLLYIISIKIVKWTERKIN